MAFIFRDWLAASESLPLEGIGVLQWERRPAYVSEPDSIVYPANWELCLAAQSDAKVPDTVFERMAIFSRLPVNEIRQQYSTWLHTIKSDEGTKDLFGYGVLTKDDRNSWSWSANALPSLPTASLACLPGTKKPTSQSGWDVGFWLVMVGSLLVMGFLGWLIQQKGCTPEIGTSVLKTELAPDHSGTLPYQEIR